MVLMFWLIKPTFAFPLLCNSVGSVPKYFAYLVPLASDLSGQS